jgi:hypothetical protein
MADFSQVEVVENGSGGMTLIFDLDDQTIKELEDVLQVSHTSPSFAQHFQAFVESGLSSYLNTRGTPNE